MNLNTILAILLFFFVLRVVVVRFLCCRSKKSKKKEKIFNKDFKGRFEKNEGLQLKPLDEIRFDFTTQKHKYTSGSLRIVSYNIWEGKRLGEVIEDLRDAKGDVYLLQEVECNSWKSGYYNTGKEIAAALEMNLYWVVQRVDEKRGYRGDAVMTKYEFAEVDFFPYKCQKVNEIHTPRDKIHAAPCPTVKFNDDFEMQFVSLHLDPEYCGKIGRVKQMKEILEHPKIKKDVVIGGDFNTLCTGLARFYIRKYSPDFASALGGIFRESEAEYFYRQIKKYGFFDPWKKGSCCGWFSKTSQDATVINYKGAFAGKLDWILLQKGWEVINKEIRSGGSDHELILVDVKRKYI